MLKEYMHSLQSLRKLTAEDERRLWKKYKKDGSIDARQILIENYQLLVCREVMKFPVQETVKMDLIQEGMVGLLEAAERYNPSLQVAFSLYAVHRVRGRMLDFLQKKIGSCPVKWMNRMWKGLWESSQFRTWRLKERIDYPCMRK